MTNFNRLLMIYLFQPKIAKALKRSERDTGNMMICSVLVSRHPFPRGTMQSSRKQSKSEECSDKFNKCNLLLHTTHNTPYTLHTDHYKIHNTYCTLHITHYPLHTTHYTLHTTYCILHNTHYTLYLPRPYH